MEVFCLEELAETVDDALPHHPSVFRRAEPDDAWAFEDFPKVPAVVSHLEKLTECRHISDARSTHCVAHSRYFLEVCGKIPTGKLEVAMHILHAQWMEEGLCHSDGDHYFCCCSGGIVSANDLSVYTYTVFFGELN